MYGFVAAPNRRLRCFPPSALKIYTIDDGADILSNESIVEMCRLRTRAYTRRTFMPTTEYSPWKSINDNQ